MRRFLDEGRYEEAIAHAEVVGIVRPIRVLLPGSKQDEALRSAAKTWNAVLGFEVFEIVKTAPDVRFLMVPNLQQSGQAIAGWTDWKREVWHGPSYRSRISAQVKMRTVLPCGKAMPKAAIRHTAMHELGHVLGLDHGEGGVMGPLDIDRPCTQPSPQEIALLRGTIAEARRIRAETIMIGVLNLREVH